MIPQATIADLHRVFCEETGAALRLGIGEYNRERCWFEFAKAGFTAEDLRLVIRYLRRQIKAGDRRPGALKFSNLIERLDAFEEELVLAKGDQRNKTTPPTPREIALQALRPAVDPASARAKSGEAKPIGEYIQALRKAVE